MLRQQICRNFMDMFAFLEKFQLFPVIQATELYLFVTL